MLGMSGAATRIPNTSSVGWVGSAGWVSPGGPAAPATQGSQHHQTQQHHPMIRIKDFSEVNTSFGLPPDYFRLLGSNGKGGKNGPAFHNCNLMKDRCGSVQEFRGS